MTSCLTDLVTLQQGLRDLPDSRDESDAVAEHDDDHDVHADFRDQHLALPNEFLRNFSLLTDLVFRLSSEH